MPSALLAKACVLQQVVNHTTVSGEIAQSTYEQGYLCITSKVQEQGDIDMVFLNTSCPLRSCSFNISSRKHRDTDSVRTCMPCRRQAVYRLQLNLLVTSH